MWILVACWSAYRGRCVAAVGDLVELGEFVPGSGEADLRSFYFAEPALASGFLDPGDQVVGDFEEAGTLGGVRAKEWAA